MSLVVAGIGTQISIVISPVVAISHGSWDRLGKNWKNWLKGRIWELQELPLEEPLLAGRIGRVRGRDLLSTIPFSSFSMGVVAVVKVRLGVVGVFVAESDTLGHI